MMQAPGVANQASVMTLARAGPQLQTPANGNSGPTLTLCVASERSLDCVPFITNDGKCFSRSALETARGVRRRAA